jgi:hypothetical protein
MAPVKASRAILALILLLVSLTPDLANASQTAKLAVALKPERLGTRTTIIFNVRVIPHSEPVPSPVIAMSLFYPANIGLVTSGLGLQTCAVIQLEANGRCPANSLMGYGNALVEFPIGSESLLEEGQITTWMAPVHDGHLALLFYAEAPAPIFATLIFTGQIREAQAPFGGQIATSIPPIETLPGAPDASLLHLTATVGPMNVTYYARYRGKRIPYHPNGLRLPETCPRGGFPFAANFTFLDGSHARAKAAVPCPSRHPRARRHGAPQGNNRSTVAQAARGRARGWRVRVRGRAGRRAGCVAAGSAG